MIAMGTVVTWTNNDTHPHTVTADAGDFDSGSLAPGQILGWMGMKCPLDRPDLTAERVEASRQIGVQTLAGNPPAPVRFVSAGLRLDQTTEAEASSWAERQGITCVSQIRGMHFLKCADVKLLSGGADSSQIPIHMLTLAFNPQDKLVAVDIFRRKLKAEEASHLMRELSATLNQKLGQPTQVMGGTTPEPFSGNLMKTAFVHYRFQDYLVMLTVSRIPWSAVIIVHEQYSSASKKTK